MNDVFREVSHQSWFSRIMGSFVGALLGLLLFVVSFPLLFWNEGRAVNRAKTLDQGQKAVVSIAADQVDPAHDGQLVHLSGTATTEEQLADPQFGVQENAIKLARQVEMYQWEEDERRETRKKLGGSTETVTTYSYDKKWLSSHRNSSNFRHPEGHANPAAIPFQSITHQATQVQVGAFALSPSLVSQIDGWSDLPVTADQQEQLAEELKSKLKISGGKFYLGADSAAPQVGDVRIAFRVVKPQEVSILSGQKGPSFVPWHASNDDTLDRLALGQVSAADMFKQLAFENSLWTWGLRAGGFLLMAIGLSLVFRPLSTLGDVVPLIGNLMQWGTGLFAGVVGGFLSLSTIAIAWIFYRPLIGILILVVAVALVVGAKMLFGKSKTSPS